ncbi:uncharacterized protein [Nicotiana tomentosiformis]|uniref:uncharacterized protein isoform X1 n=1 Tax=Nicotiana tomentosiformis TaxID=4098 RepID=UPI00388C685A
MQPCRPSRLGDKMRLVSTDKEAAVVAKNILSDWVHDMYFEHLDAYIEMGIEDDIYDGQNNSRNDNHVTVGEHQKEVGGENSSSSEDFEDSENDLSDENDLSERIRNEKRRYEVSEELQRKLNVEDGESNCCNSDDTRSLQSDSDTESLNFPKFNPKTDGKNPKLALELTFGNKRVHICCNNS